MPTFSIVTATNNEDTYNNYLLKSENLFTNRNVEVLCMKGSSSIAHAYNNGATMSTGTYLGFLHHDIIIQDPDWDKQLESVFKDKSIGVIGFVGSDKLTIDGRWWLTGNRHGRFYQGEGLVEYDKNYGELYEVASVDGFGFFTPREVWEEIKFDEQYPGFHMYDSDYCTAVKQKGYKVVVYTLNIKHMSGGILDWNWQQCKNLFANKWKGIL